MKITVEQPLLKNVLSKLVKSSPAKTTAPQLKFVFISVQPVVDSIGDMTLRTTDFVSQLQMSIPVEIDESDTIETCVNVRDFYNAVSGMESSKPIILIQKDNKLRIKSGRRNIGLPMMSVDNFPPALSIDGDEVLLPCNVFANCATSVFGYSQKDNDKGVTVLRGVNVSIKENNIVMIARNETGAAYISALMDDTKQNLSITIFEEKLKLAISVFDVFDTLSLIVSNDQKHIAIHASDEDGGVRATIVIVALVGEYPDIVPVIKQMITTENITKVVVNRDSLINVLSAASFIEDEYCKILPRSNVMSFDIDSSGEETFSDELDAVIENSDGVVICNRSAMLEAVRNIQSDTRMYFTNSGDVNIPMLFLMPDKEQDGIEYIQCLAKYVNQ